MVESVADLLTMLRVERGRLIQKYWDLFANPPGGNSKEVWKDYGKSIHRIWWTEIPAIDKQINRLRSTADKNTRTYQQL